MFMGLNKSEKEKLKFEVISTEARLRLTRLVHYATSDSDMKSELIKQNKYINIARNVLNLSLYVLKADDRGEYHYTEYAWHNGELELIMRRPNTIQLIEILGDLIQNGLLGEKEVNEILEQDNVSIKFNKEFQDGVSIHIYSIDEIEEKLDSEEHPNIRALVERMDGLLEKGDYSAVLHTSASIFETLAKDIIDLETIQDKSLGSFFDRYKNDSNLPDAILDHILEIFEKRNEEPLAAHGNLEKPSVSEEEAIILVKMTKAFINIERELSRKEIEISKSKGGDE